MEKGFKLPWTLLALFSLIPAAASGKSKCNGERDCTFSPDRHMCSYTFSKDHECCDVDCLQKDDIASFEPGSLTIEAEYTSAHRANIVAKWKYIKNRKAAYPIQISIVQGDKRTCLCLPPGVTQFKTDVWDPPRVCHNAEPRNISVQLQLRDPLDAVKHLEKKLILHKCWSTMGNKSHSVCGPEIPSPPLNASAVAEEEGNGTSQVTVNWQAPSHEFTPVVSYFLELVYRDETKVGHPVKAISQRVPRASNNSMYTFHGVPMRAGNQVYALVRAGVVQGAHRCICCITFSEVVNPIIYGYPANATAEWAGGVTSSLDTVPLVIIAAPITAAVVLILLVVATATCSVYCLRRCSMVLRKSNSQVECPAVPKDKAHLIPWFTDANNGDWV